jgi:hypothetical protein
LQAQEFLKISFSLAGRLLLDAAGFQQAVRC